MALNIKLDVSLQQKLVLTPALQQAIKLLQLNRVELLEEIHQELVQNPTLEETSDDLDGNIDSDDNEDFKRKKEEASSDSDSDEQIEISDPIGETEWERYFQNDEIEIRNVKNYDYSEFVFADNFVNKKSSLSEHLLWQLGLTHLSEDDKNLATKIIDFINDDGYLKLEENVIADELEVEIEKIRDLIDVIQEFDPAGICAKDLRECLLNQIIMLRREFIDTYSSIDLSSDDIDNAERITDGYLDLLETRQYSDIRKGLDLNDLQIEKAIKIISGLEPKPGRQFYPESPSYIVPDVYVLEDSGEFIVLLNDDDIPKLKLSEFYRNIAKKKIPVTKETKKFVEQKINSAVWFIKSIEQRKQTILNVAKQIVEFQGDFLRKGITGLKPLTLQDVAGKLDIHESTVSRVVNNKYLHTPQGLYEMKFFFHGGLRTNQGDSVSSVVIKNMIKNLIQQEEQQKPLNDREIADSLKVKGIKIARRTVAKYRESLNILSSNQRKREYKRLKTMYRRDQ